MLYNFKNFAVFLFLLIFFSAMLLSVNADMAELVDAVDSKSAGSNPFRVRFSMSVLFFCPNFLQYNHFPTQQTCFSYRIRITKPNDKEHIIWFSELQNRQQTHNSIFVLISYWHCHYGGRLVIFKAFRGEGTKPSQVLRNERRWFMCWH